MRKIGVIEFAQRAKVEPATIRSYKHRAGVLRRAGKDRPGLLPEPDGHEEISGTPWWWESTADEWIGNRIGRGARTDLLV